MFQTDQPRLLICASATNEKHGYTHFAGFELGKIPRLEGRGASILANIFSQLIFHYFTFSDYQALPLTPEPFLVEGRASIEMPVSQARPLVQA